MGEQKDFIPENLILLRTLIGHENVISNIHLTADSQYLVSCSRDESVRVWDKKTGYCLNTIQGDHGDWVRCCDSNNEFLVTSGNSRKVISY